MHGRSLTTSATGRQESCGGGGVAVRIVKGFLPAGPKIRADAPASVLSESRKSDLLRQIPPKADAGALPPPTNG